MVRVGNTAERDPGCLHFHFIGSCRFIRLKLLSSDLPVVVWLNAPLHAEECALVHIHDCHVVRLGGNSALRWLFEERLRLGHW